VKNKPLQKWTSTVVTYTRYKFILHSSEFDTVQSCTGLVVGNHVHDYTSSEMKTPQAETEKKVYHKIIPQ